MMHLMEVIIKIKACFLLVSKKRGKPILQNNLFNLGSYNLFIKALTQVRGQVFPVGVAGRADPGPGQEVLHPRQEHAQQDGRHPAMCLLQLQVKAFSTCQ